MAGLRSPQLQSGGEHAPYLTGTGGSGAITTAQLAAAQPFIVTQPESYGAVHNGRVIYDAEITFGTKKLKAPVSKPFTTANVGQNIAICACGTVITGEEINSISGKISAFISAEEVELEVAAPSTVKGALALFATDDTNAIQEAINAAVTACRANGSYYCEVWLTEGIYGVAGALKTTQKGNAQITLPLIESTLAGTTAQGSKVTLMLRGNSDSTSLPQWYQKTPQQTGACLFSFGPFTAASNTNHQPAYSPAFGRPAVIGGATPEQGFTNLNYSNMLFCTTGVTMSAPQNNTLTGLELNGVAQASLPTHAAFTLGIPGLGLTRAANPNIYVKPKAGIEGEFLSQERAAVAVGMPAKGNNDNSYVGSYSVEGWCVGLEPNEHGWHADTRIFYCWLGINFSTPGTWEYGSVFGLTSVGECRIGVCSAKNAEKCMRVRFLMLDVEENFIDILDEKNSLSGDCYFINQEIPGAPKVENEKAEAPKYLKVIWGERSAGAVAAPTIETGVPVKNPFWRDAFITITGATKVVVDGAEELISTSAMLPSGKVITVTGVGLAWKWTLL